MKKIGYRINFVITYPSGAQSKYPHWNYKIYDSIKIAEQAISHIVRDSGIVGTTCFEFEPIYVDDGTN